MNFIDKLEIILTELSKDPLKEVFYLYSFSDLNVSDEHQFSLKENSVDNRLIGLFLVFKEHTLKICQNDETDEILLDLVNALPSAAYEPFAKDDYGYVLIPVSKHKPWKKYLKKSCFWIWAVINSQHYIDGLQLSFDDLKFTIQILAFADLKVFELKKIN